MQQIDALQQTIFGVRIVINDTRMPKKAVRPRKWHEGRCYAPRVNKKWLKKHGTTPLIGDGQFYRMHGDSVIMVNSQTWKDLKERLPEGRGEPPAEAALRVQAAVESVARFAPVVPQFSPVGPSAERLLRAKTPESVVENILRVRAEILGHEAKYGKQRHHSPFMLTQAAPMQVPTKYNGIINIQGA